MKQQICNDVALRLICRRSSVEINEPFQIVAECCRSTDKPTKLGRAQRETNSSGETPPDIVASLCGKLEGTVCTRYASQQEVRQFLAIPLHFERVLEQRNESAQDYKTDKRGSSGAQLSFRFTSGVLHRFDAHLRVPEGYPGTLQTKNTYVEYVISVRLRLNIKGSSTPQDFSERSQLRVQPKFDLKRFLSYQTPIQITKTFNRSVFFLSKSKTVLSIQLEKTAFLQGERIVIRGKVVNENSSRTLKGLIQLIMINRANCKKNSKEFALTITRSPIVGTAANCGAINKFESSLTIPADAHPTFLSDTVPLECHYQVSVSIYDCEPIQVPVLIGTHFGDSDKLTAPISSNYQPNETTMEPPHSQKKPPLTYYAQQTHPFTNQHPCITFPLHSYHSFRSNYAFFPSNRMHLVPKRFSLAPAHSQNYALPGEFTTTSSPVFFPTPSGVPMWHQYSFPPIMSSQQPNSPSTQQRCFEPFASNTTSMSLSNFFAEPARYSNCASENANSRYIARSVLRIEEIE